MKSQLIREIHASLMQHSARVEELEAAVIEAEMAVDLESLAILRRHGFDARYQRECAARAALLRWCLESVRQKPLPLTPVAPPVVAAA